MTRKLLIVIFVSLFAFTGCNIFGWLYPEDTASGDSATQKLQGDTAMQKGDLNSALNYYAEAVKTDSDNSEARWGYVQAYVMMHNVDIVMLASKFASGEDPSEIITDFAGSLLTTMNTIISYLDPIASGSCDGVISQYDINVNGNLMLAYFIRGFLGNADSNGDGNYFSTTGSGGGDIMIFDEGSLTYNAAVVDIDNLQNNLNDLYDELSASVSNPSNKRLYRSTVSNIIVTTHNLIEDLMFVYKTFGSSFGDFTKAVGAFNNISQGLPNSSIFVDFKSQIDEQHDTMNGYLDGADIDTARLNFDHFMMVGYNMTGYSGTGDPPKWPDYANFVKSAFDSHSPTATTYETGKINYLYRLSNHSGDYLTNASANYTQFTNDLSFLNELFMSVTTVFTDIANANLIKNLTGGAF